MGAFARAATAAILTLLPVSIVCAQTPAEFYKTKNVDLYIGYSVGGGYDIYARLLARHMGKHIPGNPTVVPKNMDGAGSLRLANWLYNVGAKDGSAFGIIGRGTGFDPLLGHKGAQFDATKYTWIGSANDEVSICVAWHTSGITKFEDLLSRELTVGGTGASADTDQFPRIMNGMLGTKMKIVTGYPGGNDVGPRDGARRGQRPLRLVVVEREDRRIRTGCATRRSTSWCSSRSPSIPTCRMSRSSSTSRPPRSSA